jgi:hypothetical protein
VAEQTGTADVQVADRLDALARDGASGAMEIYGGPGPGGTIYLEDGYITFATSSAVPDLAARLIGSGRLSGDQWSQLLGESHPYGWIATVLVERSFISKDDLRSVLRSVALDAITAVTAAPAGGPVPARIRFTPLAWHWARSVLRLDAGVVRAEVTGRAARLTRHDIPVAARPRLSDLDRPGAVVTRKQWALARRIDGVASVQDLAWDNGFALHDTIEWVAELADRGLCTVPAPAQVSGLPPQSPGSAADLASTLPRRSRGATLVRPKRKTDRADPAPKPEKITPPPASPVGLDVLHELLEGLRRLS